MAIAPMMQKKPDIFPVERLPQCSDQSTKSYARQIETKQADIFPTVTTGGVMVLGICCLSDMTTMKPLKSGQDNNKRVGKPTLNQ